jgi:hypothetical protein
VGDMEFRIKTKRNFEFLPFCEKYFEFLFQNIFHEMAKIHHYKINSPTTM